MTIALRRKWTTSMTKIDIERAAEVLEKLASAESK